jgi:hypothetical protein
MLYEGGAKQLYCNQRSSLPSRISPLELVTIETAKKVGSFLVILAETCAKVQESAIDSNFRISSFIS